MPLVEGVNYLLDYLHHVCEIDEYASCKLYIAYAKNCVVYYST